MILIDNFKKLDDWPTYGFLYGDNIFNDETFKVLAEFDFENQIEIDPTFPTRKCITSNSANTLSGDIVQTINELKKYSNNFDILKLLIEKSFENSNLQIKNFWTHGLTSIKNLQKNVYIQFVEDEPGLYMAPHADHREVLCNMQVYISPNLPEIGTRFYQTGNYDQYKTVPFIPNSGYFSFNTHLSIHGVHNTSNQKRRSIIISWTM